jgi:cell division protein FtsN
VSFLILKTKNIKLASEEINLGITSEPVATNTTTTVPTNTVETTPTNTTAVTPTNTVEPTPTNTVASTVTPTATTTTKPITTNKSGNVNYVVQIGAYRNAIDPQALAARFGITENVRTDMHEGFTKCLVGSFGDYRGARDHRENIKSKGVNDAFVAAYSAGKRITVQEALMISNQKWFR